jgi:dipeptidyl aminopeptidase/acylaminoacyl peptidase
MKVLICIFVVLFLTPLFSQENVNKFTIYDYLSQTKISSPQFSPDGQQIVYVTGVKDKWDGKRTTNIWIVSNDQSTKMQLTNSEKADWNPRWSPDGSKMAFLSSRSEKTQVYLINVSGGEAQEISRSEEGVNQFEWINNTQIAFAANAPKDSQIVAREDLSGAGYIVGTKALKSELWIQSVNNELKPTKITGNEYYINNFSVSTDGKKFAMIIAPDSDLFNQLHSSEILVVNQNGDEIFRFNDARAFSDVDFCPDNQKISFIGNTVGYSANNALFVSDVESGTTTNLTKEFDPTINSVEWLDGSTLTFDTPRNVYTGIYTINLKSELEQILKPYWVIRSYSVNSKTKKIVFTASRSQNPLEMYMQSFGDNPVQAKSLTKLNNWIRDKKLAPTKVIQYPSFDGKTIEAVVAYPPDYTASEKYPLMVLPHGGPDGIVMDNFHIFNQLFALEGIIVFRPNFRGGIGYGSDFYAANRGKLGDIDYRDIMAGLDYLIKTEEVDTSKLVVGGWSYGGYMTNWIIGHSKRFKAAVSVAGITNTVSMYAQSDINHGGIAIWEFKGVPVLNMENFLRSSPLNFLKNCETPTLILHGEADKRVPVAQAWEIYRALIDLGTEVEMVLYPGAGHGIRAPKQYVDVFNRWIGWYREYLKKH